MGLRVKGKKPAIYESLNVSVVLATLARAAITRLHYDDYLVWMETYK